MLWYWKGNEPKESSLLSDGSGVCLGSVLCCVIAGSSLFFSFSLYFVKNSTAAIEENMKIRG